jgi:DNA-binding transcriptional MocR family regulator
MCSASWPDPALLPIEVVRRAYARAVEQLRPADLQYGGPEAHPDLARALLPVLDADGIPASAANLLVMSSIGQVLTIVLQLAPSLGASHGLSVAVEEPGYHAAFNLIEHRGHHLIGVRTDDRGVIPAALRDALASGAHVALLTPRALNPTGASWNSERRAELADVLDAFPKVLIVEDDHFAGVAGARPGSLSSDPRLQERTLYARSHSKSIAPDLRMTVVVARGRLFSLVRDARLSDGGWAPRVGQRALALALEDPELEAAFGWARAAYAARRQAAADAIRTVLPHAQVAAAADGLNIWVNLPPGTDAQEVTQQAAHMGVLVSSGEPFYLRAGRRDAVRFSVGRVDTPVARRAGELLGRAALTVDDVPLSLAL